MFKSTAGNENLEEKSYFPFTFGLKSTRGYHPDATNIAEFLKNNDCKLNVLF